MAWRMRRRLVDLVRLVQPRARRLRRLDRPLDHSLGLPGWWEPDQESKP